MATINISDLRPTGSDLFSDSESYMSELGDNELASVNVGSSPTYLMLILSSVRCVQGAVDASKAIYNSIRGE
jgi:hypothetical protein